MGGSMQHFSNTSHSKTSAGRRNAIVGYTILPSPENHASMFL